ncbi:MAG: gluconokinase [Rubrobacteraceae bacterium]
MVTTTRTDPPNDCILTIDLGSSSVRATLHDGTGTHVEGTEEQISYEFDRAADGTATKDADDLLSLTARAIDGVLSKAGGRGISAVATSTFWHSVLGMDSAGVPTTPILTWSDRRAAEAAAELRSRLDEETIHRRTGCVLHSSYLPAKLLWLSRANPEAFEKSELFLSPGEYMYSKLFGEARAGTSMASATGLFNQNEKRWDREVLAALPVNKDQLSEISDEPSQGLLGEWAERWPTLKDVPWFPAVGDGACSNIGSGCVTPDRLALMVGTSGAMRVLWREDHVEVPPGPWCYRADSDRFVMGGALSDGGNLVAWLRETLRLPDEEQTEKKLATMKPDTHGLTFLPLLNGERGPGWADKANGTIAGLSMSSGPVEIMRAAMEAVALRFALIQKTLDRVFPGDKEIVASGGGLLNSPAWTQIIADALGRPVTLSGVQEASSRGAALLALEKLGKLKLEEVEAPLGDTIDPDPQAHKTYRAALQRQRQLYKAVLEQ